MKRLIVGLALIAGPAAAQSAGTSQLAVDLLLAELHAHENPILEALIRACEPIEADDLRHTTDCLLTLKAAGGWENTEQATEDEIRFFLSEDENLVNAGKNICIHHPKYGNYAFEPEGSLKFSLFLGGCANAFTNALRAARN